MSNDPFSLDPSGTLDMFGKTALSSGLGPASRLGGFAPEAAPEPANDDDPDPTPPAPAPAVPIAAPAGQHHAGKGSARTSTSMMARIAALLLRGRNARD